MFNIQQNTQTPKTGLDLLFEGNNTTILMDLASAASNPFRNINDGVLRFLAARVVIFVAAYALSYGLLNIAAFLYLQSCEAKAISKEEITVSDFKGYNSFLDLEYDL